MHHNRRDQWMDEAAQLSLDNIQTGEGGPFGAVIVKEGKIIARGNNRVTSLNDPTAHAEVVAIREACQSLGTFQLDDCEIYTSCEPCPMCLGAIYWSRLKKIYYANSRQDAAAVGFDDALIYQEMARPLEQRIIPVEHLPNEKAAQAFRLWVEKTDKTTY
jgi:guanine deaminase